MKILYGKRTTLFPFAEVDVEYFHRLLKAERELLGQRFFKDFESFFAFAVKKIVTREWLVFTLSTKPGSGYAGAEKFGFIILDPDGETVRVYGLTDKKIMKGLLKLLARPDKYTYAEDAFRTVIEYCLKDMAFKRIEAECFEWNRLVQKLLEKVGFKKTMFVYEIAGEAPEKESENVIRKKEVVIAGSGEGGIQPEAVRDGELRAV